MMLMWHYRFGATRSAGGISISPYDLLLISEMVRTNGANKNGQIVPEDWINDIKNYKDNSCYINQDDLITNEKIFSNWRSNRSLTFTKIT